MKRCATLLVTSITLALSSERLANSGKGSALYSPTERWGISTLYDSTRSLLQSILCSLEAGDNTKWDDQTESGNACLYEMHQMSGRLYTAYKSDRFNANSAVQGTLHEKLSRAMPHARTMVIAIRHKDQIRALESGRAALVEMNGTGPSISSQFPSAPSTKGTGGSVTARRHEKPSKQIRVASGI